MCVQSYVFIHISISLNWWLTCQSNLSVSQWACVRLATGQRYACFHLLVKSYMEQSYRPIIISGWWFRFRFKVWSLIIVRQKRLGKIKRLRPFLWSLTVKALTSDGVWNSRNLMGGALEGLLPCITYIYRVDTFPESLLNGLNEHIPPTTLSNDLNFAWLWTHLIHRWCKLHIAGGYVWLKCSGNNVPWNVWNGLCSVALKS